MKKYSIIRGLITFIVVIIGIGAIGWFIWKTGHIFVSLVTDQSAVTKQTEISNQTDETNEILSLPPLKFWTCQAGIFNNNSNALQLRNELRSKGWKAELIEDSSTMVALGYFLSKEDAKAFSSDLEEQGLKTFVKEMKFPSLKFKVRGKSTNEAVQILGLSNMLLRGESPIDSREFNETIEFVFSSESPLGFEKLNDTLREMFHESLDQRTAKKYNQDLLNLYVQYSENTCKYLNNSKN